MLSSATGSGLRRRASLLAPLAVAAVMLGLLIAFLVARAATPFDGARILSGQAPWKEDGVVVHPLGGQPTGLREGDRVVAVEGKSLEAWARDRLALDGSGLRLEVGQTLTYSVIREGRLVTVPVTLVRYPLWSAIEEEWGNNLFMVVFQIVATFVFVRRPRDQAARALFVLGWSLAETATYSIGLQVADLVSPTPVWPLYLISFVQFAVCCGAAVHFTLVFPTPFLSRTTRLVRLGYAGQLVASALLLPLGLVAGMSATSFVGWISEVSDITFGLSLAALLGITVVSYVSRRDWATRQRVRLVVFATGLSTAACLAIWQVPVVITGRPLLAISSVGILLIPVPLAIAVAILRHRLFDIDVIVNRTLVYGSLTGTLALLYFASVLLLQRLLAALGFERSEVAVALSTLAIASLVSPLRQRIQSDIDRRLYRRKYNAAQAMAAFAAAARSEVDVDQFASRLVALVDDTMQPSQVAIWLRDRGEAQPPS